MKACLRCAVPLSFCCLICRTLKNGTWKIPPGPAKKVTIVTDEGTWMNLDVSHDGKTVVFDLLGDIFSMPVTGGKATLLAGGKAWEIQPRDLALTGSRYRSQATVTVQITSG